MSADTMMKLAFFLGGVMVGIAGTVIVAAIVAVFGDDDSEPPLKPSLRDTVDERD